MLYTFIKQHYDFTDDDRREALKTVEIILELSEKTRKSGLLALEENINMRENPVMKKAIALIVDGGLPKDEIEKILEKYIIFGNYTSKEVLDLLIIKEGMISILNGNNTLFIIEKLFPFLGVDFIKEAEKQNKRIRGDK